MGKRHIPHKQRMELLDAYAESGVSTKEYAAANGIGYSTLQRWLRDHKSTLSTMDNVYTSNGASLHTPTQQPAVNRQPYSRSDATVHFMDITPLSAFTKVPPIKTVADCTNVNEGISPVFSSSVSDKMAKESKVSGQTNPSEPHNQLDVFLPNGIRMTFHQTSLDTSIALIKSLA